MSLEHSPFKKVFSAGLACLVLFNTSCGFRVSPSVQDSDTRVLGWLENVLGDRTLENRNVDRQRDPEGYRFISGPTQKTESHEWSYSSPRDRSGPDSSFPSSLPEVHADLQRGGELIDEQRQYLAGHAERMAEVRAACRMVGCNGLEGVDEGVLKEARDFVRIDKADLPPDRRAEIKTREDVRQELERLEKELQQEKNNWEKIRVSTQERRSQTRAQHEELTDKVAQAIDAAAQSAAEELRISESIRNGLIDAHNAGIDKVYSTLGIDPAVGFDSGHADADNELIPSVQEANRLQKSNTLLRTKATIPSLNESADGLVQLARNSALRGDLDAFDQRIEAARSFAWASQHRGPVNEPALSAAQDLSRAAQSLESQGLFSLADHAIAKAQDLLRVGLDLARFNTAVDVSLSVMEAFSGKTFDFDDKGQPFLRECSALERGFAIGTLALGTVAVASGSAPVFAAVIAAGGAQKILKAFKEHASIAAGAEAGRRIFEETVTVAKDIDRAAPTLMAQTALSPYAKKHIWHGEIRVSLDKTKVRIDGGLHTQEGLRNYLSQAPIENAPTSREMLPNGVERVVFPDSALTKKVQADTAEAAAHGFGVANGKTLFPSSWTPETVEKVIDFARTDGRTIRIGEKGFKKEVIYEGVTVTVNFGKDGRPNSAFPSWNQGGN